MCFSRLIRLDKRNRLKKYTFEELEKLFINDGRGYILKSIKYINKRTKLQYQCPKHPDKDLWIDLSDFKTGCGCKYCAGRVKYTIEEVNEFFIKDGRGYILKSTEFINSQTKLQYQCPHHPDKELWVTLSCFKQGDGCNYCAGHVINTYEKVKSDFINRNYILKSTEYINNKTKLNYQCPHHPDKDLWIRYNDLQQGYGCPYCGLETISGIKSVHWKGGAESLLSRLRGKTECKTNNGRVWSKSIKERDNFTCQISGIKGEKLEAHHVYNFTAMVYKVLDDLGFGDRLYKNRSSFTEEEYNIIVERVIHENNNIDGITLNKKVHTLFHRINGTKYNTPEQIEEFKKRYQSGEFEEVIN